MSNAQIATSALFLLTLLPACNLGDDGGPLGTGAPDDPVALGAAEDFAILAKTGISTGSPSTITGDVGLHPASASAITGFELVMDPSNQYATSPQVNGKIYATDYAAPTPDNLKRAMDDMQRAFKDANKRKAGTKDLGNGDIGGLILNPGVYRWNSTLLIPDNVSLNGDVSDVWIFKVSQDLVMSSNVEVALTGGGMAENVFWQVDGMVDIGEGALLVGNVLAKDSITVRNGASVNGRLMTHKKVGLDANTVTAPIK
jgi:hypothetical protein